MAGSDVRGGERDGDGNSGAKFSCKSYPLYKSPLLSAVAMVREGQAQGARVLVDAHGPLAHLPLVKSALQMFDGQVAAYANCEKLCLSTWIPPIPSRAFSRLADSRLRALLGQRTPDQVTISITEECPNRCAHCALPNSGNKLSLATHTVKDIIGQILDMGTTLVIFDGGEPALYRELPELVASVDDRAISTLFTSGAGFTAALARQLKDAGLYAVNVSLDSPIEAEHDAMRGREGVFSDAMTAIENALAAGLLVDLYVVLRRENMTHLCRFHELAFRMGVHELTFFEVVSTGRWSERQDIALLPADHALLADFVRGNVAPPRIFSVPEAYKRFGCFAATSWMHVTPGGQVYPCSCYPQSWGSIFDEPIKKIWRRMGSFPYKKSKVCPMRK
ncbi:MAG: radical SAM protein [Methanothrix sp.]|jgi:MoaA/NifB/PqqE/SkfB family radical SAM enzyme